MTKFLVVLGGAALALAVYVVLQESETGWAGAETTAGKLAGWGTKQRAVGLGGRVLGKVEEIAGNVTGNRDTSDQGVFDQAAGGVRDAVGQVAQAAGKTVHDLNK